MLRFLRVYAYCEFPILANHFILKFIKHPLFDIEPQKNRNFLNRGDDNKIPG